MSEILEDGSVMEICEVKRSTTIWNVGIFSVNFRKRQKWRVIRCPFGAKKPDEHFATIYRNGVRLDITLAQYTLLFMEGFQ